MSLEKRILGILLVTALFTNGCNSQKFQKSEDGYEYMYVTKTDGAKPEEGSVITYNLEYKTDNDSLIFDSKKLGGPVEIPCQIEQWNKMGPLYKALLSAGQGDSLILKIPTQSLFEKSFGMKVPKELENTKDITLYIGVTKVMSEEEYKELQNQRAEDQVAKDEELIQKYLADSNIVAQSTPSGLHYVIIKEGTGKQAQPGKKVTVHYSGYLLDGTKFDSSYDRNQPFVFELGRGMVIPGWDEGIALLKEGGKAELYIPSRLAYGTRGAGAVIPPNSVLKFDVELIKVE
jgi:FKBP-type peptidyl-prolyl cis-trans isomerase